MLRSAPTQMSAWGAVLAVVVLAAIDLAGAYAAKEAVTRRSPGWALVGTGLFVLLFWVYAAALRYAELTPVTLGWIAALQIGVVLLDRWRYGRPMGAGAVLAIAVMLLAQAYLLLGTEGGKPVTMGAPPVTMGVPPVTIGISPVTMGVTPTHTGVPPAGVGVPPVGVGVPPVGIGVRPVSIGARHRAAPPPSAARTVVGRLLPRSVSGTTTGR